MAEQATFSVRMDKELKKQFDELCNEFGLSVSAAINVFARAVVREKRIPFDIAASGIRIPQKKGMDALDALRDEAAKNGIQGMTMDEIEEEIRLVREERKRKKEK